MPVSPGLPRNIGQESAVATPAAATVEKHRLASAARQRLLQILAITAQNIAHEGRSGKKIVPIRINSGRYCWNTCSTGMTLMFSAFSGAGNVSIILSSSTISCGFGELYLIGEGLFAARASRRFSASFVTATMRISVGFK